MKEHSVDPGHSSSEDVREESSRFKRVTGYPGRERSSGSLISTPVKKPGGLKSDRPKSEISQSGSIDENLPPIQYERTVKDKPLVVTATTYHAQVSSGSSKNAQEPTHFLLRDRSVSRSPLTSTLSDNPALAQSSSIRRSDSATSRSSLSRQGRYHESCTPTPDPTLVIGHRSRIDSAREKRERKNARRKGSENNVSLLSRRESVTNLVYSGPGESERSWESRRGSPEDESLTRLSYLRRASSVMSRMTLHGREASITPGEFELVEEDDYSRSCANSRLTNTPHSSNDSRSQPRHTSFLYQTVSFENLARNVPTFVRQHSQKNGRLVTESFILKVNYLRRRRALGDSSSTANANKRSQHQQQQQQQQQLQPTATATSPGRSGEKAAVTPRSQEG